MDVDAELKQLHEELLRMIGSWGVPLDAKRMIVHSLVCQSEEKANLISTRLRKDGYQVDVDRSDVDDEDEKLEMNGWSVATAIEQSPLECASEAALKKWLLLANEFDCQYSFGMNVMGERAMILAHLRDS